MAGSGLKLSAVLVTFIRGPRSLSDLKEIGCKSIWPVNT
ncbi:hypothetical protein C8R32_104231 [Nitrosospira sp. Nsp5]|uniref:Uncharacterized protein n=1 Tax=Nitrosospira multiformis TaxID=1231 RepID=A0ABY0TET0_9PROT|nr:hypothetical protein C8R32_104231 [Nitrosospira sp. Nsp5]SDQ72107.1 hypothetical protein SAMN05216402_2010 [Nitrosospira multiformis]